MVVTDSVKRLNYAKSFAVGIALNVIYVAVELFYGLSINSSALVADAGHNASDVLSLVIAWVAIILAKLRPFGKYTYGLSKTTILAAVINGTLILVAALFILWDALKRINNPVPLPGNIIMIVAGIGILVNALTALFFMKGKKNDLNIKGTFVHMTADAAVSGGVLAGGLIIKQTGAYWVDPLLSFIIVAVILWSAAGLLKDSFKLSVDAVPKDVNLEEVKSFLTNTEGVMEVHDLHIWALSTTETALTAHLVMPYGYDDNIIFRLREQLHEKFNIDYSTLQIENQVKNDELLNYKMGSP